MYEWKRTHRVSGITMRSIIILPRTHKQPRILSDPRYFFKRSLIRGRELQRLESFVNIFKGVDCEVTVERRVDTALFERRKKYVGHLRILIRTDVILPHLSEVYHKRCGRKTWTYFSRGSVEGTSPGTNELSTSAKMCLC